MGMQAFHTWISDISIYREYGNNIKEKCHNVLLHHHHHQTHINVLIEIFDATLSKMEAKYMKTSHFRACECKPFIHVFLIFRFTENMDMILRSHT